MSPTDTDPLRVGEQVFAEIWANRFGGYATLAVIVKGKWRIYPTERYPWWVAIEITDASMSGLVYDAGDVVVVAAAMVSRSFSEIVAPTGSEFAQEHLTGLPEVQVHHRRIVPEGAGNGA